VSPVELNAYRMQTLVEAASRYGTVLQLLELVRAMQEGKKMNDEEILFLEAASTASLLAKATRLNDGVDLE
jgi:hypothetical protein